MFDDFLCMIQSDELIPQYWDDMMAFVLLDDFFWE